MEQNLKDLKQRIRNKIPYLTASQKAIANFIVENPRQVALSSIRDLEKELHISKSTIVRLAQALGYNGFYEMKSEFLKSIRHELDPLYRFKTFFTTAHEGDYLNLISEESINNIRSTLQLIDREHLHRAVHMLERAQHVYTMGLGISTFLAEITAYLLNRVSVRAHQLVYGPNTFAEQLIHMRKQDLIVAFSFVPYSHETIDAAAYAHEKGLKVISFTDKATSPIVPYSDISMQVVVESVSVSNSVIPVLCVLYAMVGMIGTELKDRTLQTIESLQYLRQAHVEKKHNNR